MRSNAAAPSCGMGSVIADPWVHHSVENIGDDVHDDDPDSDHHDDGHDDGIVNRLNRVDVETADTRPAKDRLRDDCAADHERDVERYKCDDGNHCIAQGVFDDNFSPRQPFRLRRSQIVRMQDFEHRRSLESRITREGDEGDRDRRQREVLTGVDYAFPRVHVCEPGIVHPRDEEQFDARPALEIERKDDLKRDTDDEYRCGERKECAGQRTSTA